MPLVPLPKVPTDNLYRFMALFGLAIVVVSLVVLGMRIHSHNDKIAEVYSKEGSLKIIRQRLADLTVSTGSASQANPTQAIEQATRITFLREEIEKREIEREDAKAGLELGKKMLELSANDYTLAFISGMILAVIGFILWYVKLQRHHDKLLEARVERAVGRMTGSHNSPAAPALDYNAEGSEQDD